MQVYTAGIFARCTSLSSCLLGELSVAATSCLIIKFHVLKPDSIYMCLVLPLYRCFQPWQLRNWAKGIGGHLPGEGQSLASESWCWQSEGMVWFLQPKLAQEPWLVTASVPLHLWQAAKLRTPMMQPAHPFSDQHPPVLSSIRNAQMSPEALITWDALWSSKNFQCQLQ